MKKSLLAVLVAGILLITAGAFAGTITISQIPDVVVVDDGDPSGTAGDDLFQFSQAFNFGGKVSVAGGTSSEPITLSYIVTGESGAIAADTVVTIEGVAHGTAVDGNGETAAVELGTVTALDVDGVLAVEYAAMGTYDSGTDYSKQIKILGENGDTNPGSSAAFNILVEDYVDATTFDRFSGEVTVIAEDDFDGGANGWTWTGNVLGTLTSDSSSSELSATYTAATAYGYWQRVYADDTEFAWEADTLYRMVTTVSSSTDSTTEGARPDYRLYASDAGSAALNIRLINSAFSTGTADFISPTIAGVEYEWVFEPIVVASNTNDPIVQFEGYNVPGSTSSGARPDRVNETVAMKDFRLETLDGIDADGAGTAVQTLSSVTDFGAAYGWAFGVSPDGVDLTGVAAGGTLTISMPTAPGAGEFAYGSWAASAFASPTSTIPFEGEKLYRLRYKVTTNDFSSGSNHIIAVPRVNSGDFHVATGLGLYGGFGNNVNLTTSLATTPDLDLWWYYEGATRAAGAFYANCIFPSLDGQVNSSALDVPVGNTLTLSEIAITDHGSTPDL